MQYANVFTWEKFPAAADSISFKPTELSHKGSVAETRIHCGRKSRNHVSVYLLGAHSWAAFQHVSSLPYLMKLACSKCLYAQLQAMVNIRQFDSALISFTVGQAKPTKRLGHVKLPVSTHWLTVTTTHMPDSDYGGTNARINSFDLKHWGPWCMVHIGILSISAVLQW